MIKILAILFLSVGVTVYLWVKWLSLRNQTSRKSKTQQLLLQNGTVIDVPLYDCDIKCAELEGGDDSLFSTPSQIEMIDALFGKQTPDPVSLKAAYILYSWRDKDGRTFRFMSSPILLPVESLRLRLDEQRSTKIYFDPSNTSHYFFDINFLTSGKKHLL